LFRNFLGQEGLSVDLPFRIDVDQDLGVRKPLLQRFFNTVEPVMRRGDWVTPRSDLQVRPEGQT